MNSKTLAILPLIAMVFTVGLVSSVQASNWEIETTFAGDGSGIGNVSENPAVAERAILRPNSYGNFQSPAQTVCGVHNIELQDRTNQNMCKLARKINEVIEDYNKRVGSDGI